METPVVATETAPVAVETPPVAQVHQVCKTLPPLLTPCLPASLANSLSPSLTPSLPASLTNSLPPSLAYLSASLHTWLNHLPSLAH